MPLLQRCRYFLQSRLAVHRSSPLSFSTHHDGVTTRLLHHHQSPLPALSAGRIFDNNCSTVILGKYGQWDGGRIQLGTVFGKRRWLGTYSRSNEGPRRKAPPRKGYLNVKDFQSVEEAADVAFGILDDLNPRSLSSFWTRVSQLMTPRSQRSQPRRQHLAGRDQHQQLHQHLSALYSLTMEKVNRFEPKDLSQTALALGKIMKEVDNHGRGRSQGLHHQILHNILIGQDSREKELSFQSIANVSVINLSKFDARDISNLAYACAIAGFDPVLEDGSSLMQWIAKQSIPILRKFNPQDLSNMVWAFEKVGSSSPQLFDAVANSIVAMNNLGHFKPQELANLVMVFAKAEESHPRLFRTVADHIVSESNLGQFHPQGLANTVWAFAKAEESHPRLFKTVADHIVSECNLGQFNSQELTNTVWAFAKAGEFHSALFKKVAEHVTALDNLHSFNSKSCSQLLWAFATADIIHRQLFEKVAARGNSFDFGSLDERSRMNLLWAYEKAEKALEEGASEN